MTELSSDFDIFPSPLLSNLRNTSSSSRRLGRAGAVDREPEEEIMLEAAGGGCGGGTGEGFAAAAFRWNENLPVLLPLVRILTDNISQIQYKMELLLDDGNETNNISQIQCEMGLL